MISAILKAVFASIILILAIAVGSLVGQIFAFISVGGTSVAFAIAGTIIAIVFAGDFVKNELYGKDY